MDRTPAHEPVGILLSPACAGPTAGRPALSSTSLWRRGRRSAWWFRGTINQLFCWLDSHRNPLPTSWGEGIGKSRGGGIKMRPDESVSLEKHGRCGLCGRSGLCGRCGRSGRCGRITHNRRLLFSWRWADDLEEDDGAAAAPGMTRAGWGRRLPAAPGKVVGWTAHIPRRVGIFLQP